MFPALLATILFSLSVIFATRTTRILGGTTANFYRLCVSAVLLAGWAHLFGGGLGGGAFGWFFLSGCIGFGVGDLALYQALPRIGPRLTSLMVHCLAAPFAALAEWTWMRTELKAVQIVFGLVILAGVAIALAPDGDLKIPRRILTQGILLGIVAALGQGLGAVVSRKAYAVAAVTGQPIDGLTAAYQRILGGLIFAALPSLWVIRKTWIAGSLKPAGAPPDSRGPGKWRRVSTWVLLNSLAGPTLGVGCYQWGLQTAPSGVVLPIVATTPLVVIPFAYLLDGDRPGFRSVIGGVVAVAGVVGLTLAR